MKRRARIARLQYSKSIRFLDNRFTFPRLELSSQEGGTITEFRKQTNHERQELAERLRLAREDTGLSQQDVAAALGVSQSIISMLENGQRRLDMSELKALAKVYDRDPGWFLRAD
jgi:ribosome-binding protein aMBF1 (putative translation factor)